MSSPNNVLKIKLMLIAGVLVAVAALAITKPTQGDLDARIAQDGWVPVDREHTNAVVASWTKIRGFKGGHATYVGVLGTIMKMPWSDE